MHDPLRSAKVPHALSLCRGPPSSFTLHQDHLTAPNEDVCSNHPPRTYGGAESDAASWHSAPTPSTHPHNPPPRRYKEAVNECTAALDNQPNFFKALVRRAKAYEQMGLFKQALNDFQRANKLDTATTDTRVRLGGERW